MVQRSIRLTKQVVMEAPLGKCNADAERILGEISLGILKDLVDRVNLIPNDLLLICGHLFHDHREFISADPEYIICFSEIILQKVRNLNKRLVAHIMSVIIIDRFEHINIYQ